MGSERIVICTACGAMMNAFGKNKPQDCQPMQRCTRVSHTMMPLPSEVTTKAQGPGLIWTDMRSGRRFAELSLLLEERQRAEEAAERQAKADAP